MTTASGHDVRVADHFFLAAQRWLHRSEAHSVVLLCHGGQDAPLGTKHRPAVEAPGCLQELPLHRVVDLSLAGVEEIAVAPGACCTAEDLGATVRGWGDALGGLLNFTLSDARPGRNWSWSLSPTRVPVDRRGLLGLRQAAPAWPTHDPGADDQSRLLRSLRAAGVSSLEEAPPGLVLLASGCTACGVCVASCPHDALTLTTNDGESSLVHAPDACHGEQQCVALCPVDALTVAGPLSWEDVLEATPRVLTTLRVSVCERCQAHFPSDSESPWCEPCRIRRSDPFGSHLPAAAIELMRARSHRNS